MRWLFGLGMIIWSACTAVAMEQPLSTNVDSSVLRDTVVDTVSLDVDSSQQVVRNPVIAATASALIPGAGQVYNGRYVKGALLLGTEALIGSYALYWYRSGGLHDNSIAELRKNRDAFSTDTLAAELLAFFENPAGGMDEYRRRVELFNDRAALQAPFLLALDSSQYNQLKKNHRAIHALGWGGGLYLYNIMDALDKTGHFKDDLPRDPIRAGWLSAIPGLALGQLYNGSLAKAGLIWMVQGSLGVLWLNYHRQMRICERHREEIGVRKDGIYRDNPDLASYDRYWRDERGEAFQNRNTYLWYSVFFYFFGIFDAVVDAHLHDFEQQMRVEPDLGFTDKKVGARLTLDF